jgi:hypothetical protein
MREDPGAEEGLRNGVPRSPEWPKVEKAHLAKQPRCVCCAGAHPDAPVQVHHMFPFHYCVKLGRPDLELDDRNLITLCEDEAGKEGQNHHLLVGHLDDWQSSNVAVHQDATKTFEGMTAAAIQADPRWKAKEATRLKPLDQMTDADKQAFKAAMDRTFPKL